jgi:GAF domain-containing protein
MDDYGPPFNADLRQGRTVEIGDVRHDPRTSSADALAAFARASISGFLNVPRVRRVAILAVHSLVPHAWTADEVASAEEITARTWDAVERARAEAALRASERHRLQLALGASGMVGLFDWQLAYASQGEDWVGRAHRRAARLHRRLGSHGGQAFTPIPQGRSGSGEPLTSGWHLSCRPLTIVLMPTWPARLNGCLPA